MSSRSTPQPVTSFVTRGFDSLEDEGYPTNIVGRVTLESLPDKKTLVKSLQQNLWTFDKFRSSIVDNNWQFNADDTLLNHVVEATFASEAEFNTYVAKAAVADFPKDKSPWQLHILTSNESKQCELVFVLAHVLGDGVTFACLMGQVLSPARKGDEFWDFAHKWKRKTVKSERSLQEIIAGWTTLIWALLFAIIKILLLPFGVWDASLPLKIPMTELTRAKSIGFGKRTVTLTKLKAMAKAVGPECSVNDVLQTACGMGMSAYMQKDSKFLNIIKQNTSPRVRVFVVVNTRPVFSSMDAERVLHDFKEVAYDTNHFSYVVANLLVDPTKSGKQLLTSMTKNMQKLKGSPEPFIIMGLLKLVAKLLGDRWGFWINKCSMSRTSGFLSNTPGPQLPLTFAGVPVVQIANCVTPAGFPWGVSFLSYNGHVSVGACTDVKACDNAQEIVDCIVNALDILSKDLDVK